MMKKITVEEFKKAMADKTWRHIFSEILDVDSAIQALGRKRKVSDDDHCTFYIKNYTGQEI